MKKLPLKFLLPLGIFLILVTFLSAGLKRDPREIPSPLIGKNAPSFELPSLQDHNQLFTPNQMNGKVWLLNVWASWCTYCRNEHPFWFQLAQSGIPVVGLNYKDQKENAIRWLKEQGDPYVVTVKDDQGKVGLEYGVYGVPETFVIDQKGTVRYKQIGPLTEEILKNKILPLIQELQS